MVRINLLPQKREARRATTDQGQPWMFGIIGAVVLEIVILLFVHQAKQSEFARIQSENGQVQNSIDGIKSQIANHDEIKTQLKLFRDREAAIDKLQSGRTGPTASLLEIARILSKDRGPTTDRDKLAQLQKDNPSAVPNVNWDGHRLWLTGYTEAERTVRVMGNARDGEDVSEFLKRLQLSDYFSDVRLLPASKVTDPSTAGVEVVKFELSAKVKY